MLATSLTFGNAACMASKAKLALFLFKHRKLIRLLLVLGVIAAVYFLAID